MNAREIRAGNRQLDGLRARGDDQRVERNLLLPGDDHAAAHVDAACFDAHDPNAMLLVEARRPERDPLLGRVAGEIILGEVRPVVWRAFVGLDDHDRACVSAASKHFDGSRSSCAGTDHDH